MLLDFIVVGNVTDWLPNRSLTLAVWCGLLILTIWLLLLARTRWGQARPLSKCVMLSIFAHLLFGVYAYGTRIFVDYALLPPDPPMQVHLIMGGDADDSGESAARGHQSVDPNEWAEPTDTVMIDPPPADLPRVDADLQEPNPIVASQVTADISPDVPLPSLESEHSQPPAADLPLPEPTDNSLATTDAAPIATPEENDVDASQTLSLIHI